VEAIVPQLTVGLIGLGLMGRPMGHNLLKAGFPLVVWNRTASRADSLVTAGARLAASPSEAAAAADVLISIVSDPPALEAVLWSSNQKSGGAFAALKKGAIYIDSSTVSPVLARKIADASKSAGIRFLDAPVTGGTWGAEKGELLFMVGGEIETLEAARPVISAMGKKIFHLGPNGAGQTIKLAMNLLLALQVDAFAEALALATGAGVAGEKLVEVMQSSMARSGVLDVKAPVMLKGDYTPSFPLRLMHKDLGLALDLGNQLGIPLPAAAAAREIYNSVKGSSKDDLDYAAVFKFWKK
jgi:3-hydroxyisobutyrate dehydrogenase-like beta-hydroxyacid dehydrogenase